MVIPAGGAHPLGSFMVRDNFLVTREGLATNATFHILLDNLAVQQLLHLCRGPAFSVSSRMVRIFDAFDGGPGFASASTSFPTAAKKRFVNWTTLVPTEFHGVS